jgi:hypothetical protein
MNMLKIISFAIGLMSFTAGYCQPGSDIYLFDLENKNGSVTISNGKNITSRVGYDNQPFFHPKKSLVYFVSADTSGRTDIFEFDYKSTKTRKVTSTHDREYSPTVTPDFKFISCILQRDSGQQDLVKYPIDGGDPKILIDNLIVGYHAWLDQQNVAVFTLPQPFALHVINLEKKSDSIITTGISRSIHKIPGRTSISFIQKINDATFEIREVSGALSVKTIAQSLNNIEHDMAWTPDGKIIMSEQKKLFYLDLKTDGVWKEILLPPGVISKTISRIAVNFDGKKIALVVSEDK